MKQNNQGSGTLHVVATPLGNLDDISARALRTLREVDLIACEDTRRTAHLLGANQISTPSISYFEHNEQSRIPDLIARLKAGTSVALVTDAGTPAISDPGYRLVRAALDSDIRVTAIPGPSAIIAALSIAGLPTDRFIFEGFLPARSGERVRALERLKYEPRTMVFYESPRRLRDTLHAMVEIFGGGRDAAVLRELTKTHEETVRGSLTQIARHFAEREPLGEITIILAGADRPAQPNSPIADDAAALAILREAGLSLKDAAEVIAKLTGARKRDIYQRSLLRKASDD